MSRLLGRDDILAADDLPSEDVDVPEWGGTVRVQGLDGRGRDEYLISQAIMRGGQIVGQDIRNTSAKLVARCIIGEDGEPVFGAEHVDILGQKSAAALDRVFRVATRLSGLTDESTAELGKDSGSTPNGVSTSVSAGNSAG